MTESGKLQVSALKVKSKEYICRRRDIDPISTLPSSKTPNIPVVSDFMMLTPNLKFEFSYVRVALLIFRSGCVVVVHFPMAVVRVSHSVKSFDGIGALLEVIHPNDDSERAFEILNLVFS